MTTDREELAKVLMVEHHNRKGIAEPWATLVEESREEFRRRADFILKYWKLR